MRLTIAMADWLVDRVAQRLNAGTLTIHSGAPPGNPYEPSEASELVTLQFKTDAFQTASQGLAVSNDLAPAVVKATGVARWAALATSTGEVIADVLVREVGDPDVELGDVIVDRTDFHRGGLCVLERVTLTVPLRP